MPTKAPSPVADYIRKLVRDWQIDHPGQPKIILAKRGGFTPSAINQLEMGQGVREESYPRWAKALGLDVGELVRQAWLWAPTQEKLEQIAGGDGVPDSAALAEAIESVKTIMRATDAEIRTALTAFRLDELRERDATYWLQMLLAEVGARRGGTTPEKKAQFALAAVEKKAKAKTARERTALKLRSDSPKGRGHRPR